MKDIGIVVPYSFVQLGILFLFKIGVPGGRLEQDMSLRSSLTIASVDLAHQCVDHPSFEKLCLLVPSLSTLKSLQCELC